MILALSLGESVVNHFARRCVGLVNTRKEHGGPQAAYHFALPREQNEVTDQQSVR